MNRYGKTISLLLINMMFLLPACRRAEINHLMEPRGHVQEYVDVVNKKNQRPVRTTKSLLFVFFGVLTVSIIHDFYYEDGHWLPNRKLREEPIYENGVLIK
jgi:hypothetical protein